MFFLFKGQLLSLSLHSVFFSTNALYLDKFTLFSCVKDLYSFFLFQLYIFTADSGRPDDRSAASVLITVIRNLNDPEFENGQTVYFANIKDYDGRGTFVADLNATDKDFTVSFVCYDSDVL